MGEPKSADVVDKLVKAVGGKFNGLKFDVWRRTAHSVISMRNPEVAYIIEGQQCPDQVQIRPRGRTPKRSSQIGTRSRGVQEDKEQEDEETPDDDNNNETEGQQQPPTAASSISPDSEFPTAVQMSILWSMSDDIENASEIKAWHHNNWMLYNFLFLSTTGAAASFLLRYKPKTGEIPNGKAAWDGMIAKYQNSTRQRRRIMKNQLVSMEMSEGQDPDSFINELYHIRDELVEMGEVINDDSLLDIVLEGITDDYKQIKYNAEADDTFSLDKAIFTMRNMHANRLAKHGPLRKQKGRESAMVAIPSKKGKCHICNKAGHWAKDCYSRNNSTTKHSKKSSSWCSLHKTHLHDNSECRNQQQKLNGNNRNTRNGQNNGQHHYQASNNRTTTTPAHANTAIAPGSTTVVENYDQATAPSSTSTSTTSSTTAAQATPPQGIGYSFIAASSKDNIDNFTMTADTGGASSQLNQNHSTTQLRAF